MTQNDHRVGFKQNDYRVGFKTISPATLGIPDSKLNPAKWMHERIVRSINDFEQ